MKQKNKSAFLLYLPALHQGYIDWFEKYKDVKTAYLYDDSLIERMDYLRKDVRALDPQQSCKVLQALNRFDKVETISLSLLPTLVDYNLLVPDDDVTAELVGNELKGFTLKKHNPFLRWDRKNVAVNADIEPDSAVDYKDLPESVRSLINSIGNKSTDWWRRIGAVVANRDEVILAAYNEHLPTQYTPYIDGDMRMNLQRGSGIELVGSEHAEARTLALAARSGIKTDGLDLYTSTFPCPPCAKFIASAGISRLFYEDGYATGNGLDALKLMNVEIIKISGVPAQEASPEARDYPEK